MYGAAHEISVFIASSSNEGSGESAHNAQTGHSLRCMHTLSMDIDDDFDQNLDLSVTYHINCIVAR